jgi:taurine dioxygenase
VVSPLTAAIGAQVDGLDLRRPLDEEQRAEVREALMRHLVLFFRDQDVTADQQLDFATTFGPPYLTQMTPDQPGSIWAELEDTPENPPKADYWHTDVAFLDRTPDVAVLSMLDAPLVGGDTLWASLYEVYDALSPTMQHIVGDLDLDLDLGRPFEAATTRMYGRQHYEDVASAFAKVRHPLVRIHPVTGRSALFLCGAFMQGIAGATDHESDALLALLCGGLDDPNVQCRWRWRQHDLVVWDERCTNHRANADHAPAYRRVRRCLAGGGVPTGPSGRTSPSVGENR